LCRAVRGVENPRAWLSCVAAPPPLRHQKRLIVSASPPGIINEISCFCFVYQYH
jgi:hypothetical protein